MIEIWKDIDGYEGYQVSNLGNVKSLNYGRTGKEKILQPSIKKNGYLMVKLWKDGKLKQYLIHRLVAKAFIPNPNGYPCVNHKNELKTDNRATNLELVSHSFNANYGTRNKRIAEKLSIPIYCVELDKVFPSIHEAYRQIGISDGSICLCLKGKRKSAGGYHWRYI